MSGQPFGAGLGWGTIEQVVSFCSRKPESIFRATDSSER